MSENSLLIHFVHFYSSQKQEDKFGVGSTIIAEADMQNHLAILNKLKMVGSSQA